MNIASLSSGIPVGITQLNLGNTTCPMSNVKSYPFHLNTQYPNPRSILIPDTLYLIPITIYLFNFAFHL